MKEMSLKSGTKVRIKTYKKRPSFWNGSGQMDKYMGQILTIAHMDAMAVGYKMKECTQWTWLPNHFEVIDGNQILEPNAAFSYKKQNT